MKWCKLLLVGGVRFCSLALMAGCSSSKLVDTWSVSSFQAPSLNKMLVISVAKNPIRRRIWEDAFSVELVKHDVTAMSSYRFFPDAAPDTNQVIQIIRSTGFDGVLVTRRLPTEMETRYVEEYATEEQNVIYDPRQKRFVTYYQDLEHAGYVDTEKVDIRAIDVWATQNEGLMIWSATSKTPEPNSMQEVRPEIVKLVTAELTKKGIIAPER
jgi:hypothetical protein